MMTEKQKKAENQKFKQKYFDYYDDVKKAEDDEW